MIENLINFVSKPTENVGFASVYATYPGGGGNSRQFRPAVAPAAPARVSGRAARIPFSARSIRARRFILTPRRIFTFCAPISFSTPAGFPRMEPGPATHTLQQTI